MQTTLAMSTLLMGLAGGPHCIAMCGAACAGLSKQAGTSGFQFQIGRMIGYAALGAIAASSVAGLAWMSQHSAVFKPLWIFFHVLILVWGFMLLILARQPIIAEGFSLGIWSRVQHLASQRNGLIYIGMLWALMPCGLLYSALLVASLTGHIASGALSMVTFAVGSSISLILGPLVWRKTLQLNQHIGSLMINQQIAIRLSGLMLCGLSSWAISMDISHGNSLWCQQ